MRRIVLAVLLGALTTSLSGATGGGCGGTEATHCAAGAYSCGPGGGPAGGPACCDNGYNCCFGYGVCCPENYPFLAGGKCWRSDPGGASTICGKPAG